MNNDAEAIVELYERHAAVFAQKRTSLGPEKKWIQKFAALVPPSGKVLDLGCGTGRPIAEGLIADGFGVVGVDSSASLLDHARARFGCETWVHADMRGLALAQRFDGLLAWNSFFHLCPDDQRGMFAVFAAHACPNAPLMFTAGPRAGVAMGQFEGEPLYHASLDPAEYSALLVEHGFEVVSYAPEDEEAAGLTVWLAVKV